MNLTGLGFSLSIELSQVGENGGLFVMLLLTAAIAIGLGMGMPTKAIYVVVSVVLAPALVDMGISPMAAHLFIFYFGLLSFLTPPVAVASYVAAGLAGSGMWETSWEGVKLAGIAYILPFLWCYNPALIGEGSWLAIVYAVGTAFLAALLIARGLQSSGRGQWVTLGQSAMLMAAAVVVAASTIFTGGQSPLNLGIAACGIVLLVPMRPRPPVAA
jgi:TRAP-type uncharacterized transport system fused permease subunit